MTYLITGKLVNTLYMYQYLLSNLDFNPTLNFTQYLSLGLAIPVSLLDTSYNFSEALGQIFTFSWC